MVETSVDRRWVDPSRGAKLFDTPKALEATRIDYSSFGARNADITGYRDPNRLVELDRSVRN